MLKNYKSIFLFSIVFSLNNLFANPEPEDIEIKWELNNFSDVSQTSFITLDKDSNVFLFHTSTLGGSNDIYKYDAEKNLIWRSPIDRFCNYFSLNKKNIMFNPYGEIILIYTCGNLSEDLKIKKFDEYGEAIWEKKLDSSYKILWNEQPVLDLTGNIYFHLEGTSNNNSSTGVLLSYSDNGEFRWEQKGNFGSPAYPLFFIKPNQLFIIYKHWMAAILNRNGKFVSDLKAAPHVPESQLHIFNANQNGIIYRASDIRSNHYYTAKRGLDRNILWKYEPTPYKTSTSVRLYPLDGKILHNGDSIILNQIHEYRNSIDWYCFIITKLNSKGEVIFEKEFKEEGAILYINNFYQNENGNIGFIYNKRTFNKETNIPNNFEEVYFAEITSEGQLQKNTEINKIPMIKNSWFNGTIDGNQDGYYYLSYSYSTGDGNIPYDFLVQKIK